MISWLSHKGPIRRFDQTPRSWTVELIGDLSSFLFFRLLVFVFQVIIFPTLFASGVLGHLSLWLRKSCFSFYLCVKLHSRQTGAATKARAVVQQLLGQDLQVGLVVHCARSVGVDR